MLEEDGETARGDHEERKEGGFAEVLGPMGSNDAEHGPAFVGAGWKSLQSQVRPKMGVTALPRGSRKRSDAGRAGLRWLALGLLLQGALHACFCVLGQSRARNFVDMIG